MFYAKRSLWMGMFSIAAVAFVIALGFYLSTDFDSIPMYAFIVLEVLLAGLALLGILMLIAVKRGYVQAAEEGVIVFNGLWTKKFFPYETMKYLNITTKNSRKSGSATVLSLCVYDEDGIPLFKCEGRLKPRDICQILLAKGVKAVAPEPLFPPLDMKKGQAHQKRRNYAQKMGISAMFIFIFFGMAAMLIPVYKTLRGDVIFFWLFFALGLIPLGIFIFCAIKRWRLRRDLEEK